MHFDPRPLRTAAAAKGHNTVAAIAREIGSPYNTVIRWTQGRGTPAGPTLATIERAYGVTAAALFPADA
ncbi:helix-turn-helix domain-containing protein [Streptomyces coelicoflavus]